MNDQEQSGSSEKKGEKPKGLSDDTASSYTQPMQMLVQNHQAKDAERLLMNSGINPANLSESQFASFQAQNPTVQQKSIQIYMDNLGQHKQDKASQAEE